MRLYFDTNVYDFVSDTGEFEIANRLLRSLNHSVLASEFNLHEIYAIPERSRKMYQLGVLTGLATEYEKKPVPWLQAREVRFEIGRCRPQWLKGHAFEKQIKAFLKNHQESWKQAKQGKLPPRSGYRKFKNDSERGIKHVIGFQKAVRSARTKGRGKSDLYFQGPDRSTTIDTPERYWRAVSLVAWHSAIVLRVSASRDYADYLAPYLVENAFECQTYDSFWFDDVEAQNTPRNRITGLAEFFQCRRKITHGNPNDALHANFLLDGDVFVTADKGFHGVLTDIHHHLGGNCAIPKLIDRGANSAVEELARVISSI